MWSVQVDSVVAWVPVIKMIVVLTATSVHVLLLLFCLSCDFKFTIECWPPLSYSDDSRIGGQLAWFWFTSIINLLGCDESCNSYSWWKSRCFPHCRWPPPPLLRYCCFKCHNQGCSLHQNKNHEYLPHAYRPVYACCKILMSEHRSPSRGRKG